MDSPRRFTRTLLALAGAGMLAVGVVNVVVDPYDVWRVVRTSRLAAKPEQIFHDRMHKAWELRHARPDVVFLGTSRTQVGLDPRAPVLRAHEDAPVVVNAALSDGQPKEALRYLQHAHALHPVKTAIIGLDLLSFEAYATPNVEYDDRRLAVDAKMQPQHLSPFIDVVPTLFTIDALRAAARTVRRQSQPSYFHEGGQRDTRYMEERVAEQGGQRKNMLHSERSYLDSYACYRLVDERGGSAPLQDLRALVAFAREQGIALRFFFSPSHARAQLVVMAAGQWSAQQAWRREVVRMIESEARGADRLRGSGATASRGPPDVQVWDFMGADRYTGEDVPPLDDAASRSAGYWESSHYKSVIGDLVLERVLGAPVRPATEGFGVRLTAENVARENERVDAELRAWAAAHPTDAREIEQAAAEVLPASRAQKPCAPPPEAPVLFPGGAP